MTTTIKGSVDPAAAFTNLFRFKVRGLALIRFTKLGSLEKKVKMARMPDGTWQSTGQIDPMTTSASILIHHAEDRAQVLAWFAETAGNLPTAKKSGTLEYITPTQIPIVSIQLSGVQLSGQTIPELDAGGDGSPIEVECELSIDDWTILS